MTNSHNRTMGGRNSERNNASPHQNTGNYYGSSSRKIKGQKSPSSNKFFTSSISPTNSLSSSPPKYHGRPCDNGRPTNAAHQLHYNNHHQYNNNNHSSNNSNVTTVRTQQHYGSSPGGICASSLTSSQLASSPPNIMLFAGSKCYDAPLPTALPRPPRHWTLCSVAATRSMTMKSGSDFSNNLKLLLNVQA